MFLGAMCLVPSDLKSLGTDDSLKKIFLIRMHFKNACGFISHTKGPYSPVVE